VIQIFIQVVLLVNEDGRDAVTFLNEFGQGSIIPKADNPKKDVSHFTSYPRWVPTFEMVDRESLAHPAI